MNSELETANDFLASLSMKISRYLSPQIYKSIFSGQKDVTIHTERKKLTIFFSDIKNFTATTERLQPETDHRSCSTSISPRCRRSRSQHGGTIDKFIGDAMLIFFGDPETKGDARGRAGLPADGGRRCSTGSPSSTPNGAARGIEQPFRARMGINTGYCNVGNFGSADRMDYTIIGAEANLAARLQSIAEPAASSISYETYALVSDIVAAHALPSITMKGISREVVPYAVDQLLDGARQGRRGDREDAGTGFLSRPAAVTPADSEKVRAVLLQRAVVAGAAGGEGGGVAALRVRTAPQTASGTGSRRPRAPQMRAASPGGSGAAALNSSC